MFADELKTLRRLGWRHVSCVQYLALLLRTHLLVYYCIGRPPSPQLLVGACVWVHDVERHGPIHEYRVTDRGSSKVC